MDSVQIKSLTGDDLLEIVAENPGKRFELIEGELIEMSPTGFDHGKFEFLVALVLADYNKSHKWGTILTGETGFYTRGDDKTVRAADVAFISYEKIPAGESHPGYGKVAPELVVEVVSPSDRAGEIENKVQEWLDFGVLLVWVVYPQNRRVHVHSDGKQFTILNADDAITGGDVLPGFSAKVNQFFED